jgi:Paraquat-inducible protein A
MLVPLVARETPAVELQRSDNTRNSNNCTDTDSDDDDDDDDEQSQEQPLDTHNGTHMHTSPGPAKSLAGASSTPRFLSTLIPVLAIVAHGLFFYGQTAPMWRLRLSSHVDAWANATTTETFMAFDTLGIPHRNPFYYQQDLDVETFTYGYAVRQLWRAKGMPGKVLPRIAAVLLTLFSGVWPHAKLLLLNVTWLAPAANPAVRTRALRWLSALGKWSLADVLAVCVMVGVLNLDWQVDPAAIQSGLMTELPTVITLVKGVYKPAELCSLLLKYKCDYHTRIDRKVKCGACQSLVSEAFTHPSWAQSTGKEIVKGVVTSGGGVVKLRVVGMRGIYAFCEAVVLSILLSLLVDVYDHKARRTRQREEEQRLLRGTLSGPTDDHGETQTLRSMELDSGSANVHPARPSTRPPQPASRHDMYLLVGAILTAALVCVAIITPCMERRVDGAIPMLLQEILGVAWQRTYSLRGLVITTGAAGAWDILLMRTFNLFVVFGPIFRSLLCVFGLAVPLPRKIRSLVLMTVDFVGAFCAWEVFVIAMFMVDMLMPSITDTIYNNPSCAQVSENGSCLKVEFNILTTFLLSMLGGTLLLVVSGLAVSRGEKEEQQYRARLVESYSAVEHDPEGQDTLCDYIRLDNEETGNQNGDPQETDGD